MMRMRSVTEYALTLLSFQLSRVTKHFQNPILPILANLWFRRNCGHSPFHPFQHHFAIFFYKIIEEIAKPFFAICRTNLTPTPLTVQCTIERFKQY